MVPCCPGFTASAPGQPRTPGACVLHLSDGCAERGQLIIQFRDGSHAYGGEHTAAFRLQMLVLLPQHRAHQAGDRVVIQGDADDAGAALDLLVDPLQQVGAPDLLSVGLWQVSERQHVLLVLVHQFSSFWETLRNLKTVYFVSLTLAFNIRKTC